VNSVVPLTVTAVITNYLRMTASPTPLWEERWLKRKGPAVNVVDWAEAKSGEVEAKFIQSFNSINSVNSLALVICVMTGR
jgi:hypothetical protein